MLDSTLGMALGAASSSDGSRVIAEFEARAESPQLSGDVKVKVCVDELVISSLFDQVIIPYAKVSFIAFENYQVSVRTASGKVALTRMGRNAEWLYGKIWSAFNDAVLRAFGVSGNCLLEACGYFEADEWGHEFGGLCMVRLYEDCLCLLPANQNARRIPLCFLSGVGGGEYELELSLSTGERYVVGRMGANLDNLKRKLGEGVRALREETLVWHRELACDLAHDEASYASRVMPLGAAFPLSARSFAPTLAAALEGKARAGRMAHTYDWLVEFSGDQGLFVGAKPAPVKEGAALGMTAPADAAAALGVFGAPEGRVDMEACAAAGEPSSELENQAGSYMWVIAPDGGGRLAAVELDLPDGEAAATYLYRVMGQWPAFARHIDRALEAAAFDREPILLSDEDLEKPCNADISMLVVRTPSIKLLRSCFVGRAIHSSQSRWLRDVQRASESL